jgi:hypothetical protein
MGLIRRSEEVVQRTGKMTRVSRQRLNIKLLRVENLIWGLLNVSTVQLNLIRTKNKASM